jgi:hypothetical protein
MAASVLIQCAEEARELFARLSKPRVVAIGKGRKE